MCEYCSSKRNEPLANNINQKGFYLEIQQKCSPAIYTQYLGDDGYHDFAFLDINYCPMCGSPLSDEAKEKAKPRKLEYRELRNMNGQPVWLENVEAWALVSVGSTGSWVGVPFVVTEHFTWDVRAHKIKCYTAPPDEE